MNYALVAFGAALGGVGRYAISVALASREGFPWGTLAVNLLGCLLVGIAWARLPGGLSDPRWLFLVTGLLGGFTTFSAFSLEMIQMVKHQQVGPALLYVALSIGVGAGLTWLGYTGAAMGMNRPGGTP